MRLYTLSKRHFVLVFVVFFVCFGLTVLVGIKGKAPGVGGAASSLSASLGQRPFSPAQLCPPAAPHPGPLVEGAARFSLHPPGEG